VSIEALFMRSAALPVVPKVVHRLILGFRRDEVAIGEIAALLAADPVLGAKTLRLANSAYFHSSRRIATIDEALQMLGFVMVRNMVLGLGIAGSFKAVPGMDMVQFWRYSLHTASAARWLAQQLSDRNADLAFTIGLVHGLGQLVMHAAAADLMAPLDRRCHPLAAERAALEFAQLGYQYGEVSAELALRWNFPAEITHALRAVPDPLSIDPPMTMSALVHIAAWRARVEAFGGDAARAQACCPTRVGQAIGLPIRWLPEQATVAGASPGGMPPMPALSELSKGMEAMFD